MNKNPYDLTDFDDMFLEYDGDWIRNDNGNCSTATDNDIKQYIQTKIDQEVKKRDEEWIQALEKRNKAILN